MGDKGHNSNCTWHLNLTAKVEGYTTTQLVCRNCRGMSKLAYIQRSPSPPLLSCLCRERLNSFDSTVKLLIWCWVSAGSLSTLYFGFRHSLIKLRWGRAWGVSVDDKCMELVKRIIWGGTSPLLVKTAFHGPLACPCVTPQATTLCLMYM